jgi:hypothetical protein
MAPVLLINFDIWVALIFFSLSLGMGADRAHSKAA